MTFITPLFHITAFVWYNACTACAPFRAKAYHSHTTKLHLTPQTQAEVTQTLGPQVSPATLCHFESGHISRLFCGYFGTSALSYLFADVPCSSTHSLYLITAGCMCVWVREELPSCHFRYHRWHENRSFEQAC